MASYDRLLQIDRGRSRSTFALVPCDDRSRNWISIVLMHNMCTSQPLGEVLHLSYTNLKGSGKLAVASMAAISASVNSSSSSWGAMMLGNTL